MGSLQEQTKQSPWHVLAMIIIVAVLFALPWALGVLRLLETWFSKP